MKATKLIALFAFSGLFLCASGALAQGDNPDNNDAPPPMMSEYDENEVTDTYNEQVTIDSGVDATGSGQANTGFGVEPERKERLRVYSGKHDGNNVIYDPR